MERRFSFSGGLNRIEERIGRVFRGELNQKSLLDDPIEMAVDTSLGPLVLFFDLKGMKDFFKEVVVGIAKEGGTAEKDCDNIGRAINALDLRVDQEPFFRLFARCF